MKLAGATGLEPATAGFGDQCSTKLSYTPTDTLCLLRLPVQRVLPATRAELVQLHPAGIVSLVLAGAVRALLAGRARQRDDGSIFGLGHGAMSSSVARRRPRQIRGWSPGESAVILG